MLHAHGDTESRDAATLLGTNSRLPKTSRKGLRTNVYGSTAHRRRDAGATHGQQQVAVARPRTGVWPRRPRREAPETVLRGSQTQGRRACGSTS